MMPHKDIKPWEILCFIILGAWVFSFYSCDSQKRVTKALLKLERSEEYKTTRSWPHNYTFQEYSNRLNETKIQQAFYEKRKVQARIAKDKKTEKILENNIAQYQKTIDTYQKDKKFYKIYKLQSKDVKLKVKEENATQKALEKQKTKLDHKALRKQKELLKKHKTQNKNRELALKAKRRSLKKKRKEAEKERKEYLNSIKEKRQVLKEIQTEKKNANADDNEYYTNEILHLINEIKQMEKETSVFDAPIDSLNNTIILPDSVLQTIIKIDSLNTRP